MASVSLSLNAPEDITIMMPMQASNVIVAMASDTNVERTTERTTIFVPVFMRRPSYFEFYFRTNCSFSMSKTSFSLFSSNQLWKYFASPL